MPKIRDIDRWTKVGIGFVVVFGAAAFLLSIYGWSQFQAYQDRHSKRLETIAASIELPETDAPLFDLEAQQEQAEWTYALLIAAVVGSLVSIGGIAVVGLTLRETRRTNSIAREIGEDQMRAYVDIESFEVGWGGGGPLPRFLVRNTGQTPAPWFEITARAGFAERVEDGVQGIPANVETKLWSALGAQSATTVEIKIPSLQALVTDDGIYQRGQAVMVFGKVTYADLFGAVFETEFSYFAGAVSASTTTKFSKPTTASNVAYRRLT